MNCYPWTDFIAKFVVQAYQTLPVNYDHMIYFYIKIAIAIVVGTIFSFLAFKIAKHDPSQERFPKTLERIIAATLLFVASGSFIAYSSILIISRATDTNHYQTQVEKSIIENRLVGITDDYYGIHKDGKISPEFELFLTYEKPRMEAEKWAWKQTERVFMNQRFIARYGEEMFHQYKAPERDMMYRDQNIEERFYECFHQDANFQESNTLSTKAKLKLLQSDFFSEKEIDIMTVGYEKVLQKQRFADASLLLGFILLAFALYTISFIPSATTEIQKKRKVFAYIVFSIAVFNVTDYHADFEVNRFLFAVIGELALIVLGYMIYPKCQATNKKTNETIA